MRRLTVRVAAEHLGLDLVDVVLQAGHDRGVAVDDAVEDRVQDRLGTAAQQLGVVLHAVAHGGQVAGLAVSDGEHEVAADEQVDLAELDLLDVVEVAGGPQHDEERVAVAFQLGPLVGDDRVLDGELVQPELLGHGQQLRLGRPVEADPGHGVGLLAQLLVGLGEGRPGCRPDGRRGRSPTPTTLCSAVRRPGPRPAGPSTARAAPDGEHRPGAGTAGRRWGRAGWDRTRRHLHNETWTRSYGTGRSSVHIGRRSLSECGDRLRDPGAKRLRSGA